MQPKKHYFAHIPTIAIFIVFAMSTPLGVLLFILKSIDKNAEKEEKAAAQAQADYRSDLGPASAQTAPRQENEPAYGHDVPTKEQKDAKERHKLLTTLCTITRHKYICLRHNLAEKLSLLRICSSDNSTYIAVIITHAVASPLINLLTYYLIERLAVNKSVLELAAGWVRSLYQYKDTAVGCVALVHKWFHAVGSQIRIDRHILGIERGTGRISNLHVAEMTGCVGSRCGTDVAALDVSDDN